MRQTGYGMNDNVQQQIDRMHAAARVSIRPPEKGVYGSYSLSMRSGLVAAGMAGPLAIWELRWPSLAVNALVRRVRISAAAATLFTAGEFGFSLFRATGFSVLDTTGAAAAITLLGKSQARSSRFAASQLQSTTQAFAILNTANTGLTGGTKTLDNNPLGGVSAGVPVTAGTGNTWIVAPGTKLLEADGVVSEPSELQLNEGLVIRAEAVPATGTWTFTVDVDWDEIDPARYFAING
jgi:hypothetical protein